jgi:hypothetical protein
MQVLGSLDSDCRPDNDLANLISFDERFDLVCGHNPNGWDFIPTTPFIIDLIGTAL